MTAATERTHAEDGISPAVSGGSAGRAALPDSLHLARVHSAPSIADALYGHMLCAATGWDRERGAIAATEAINSEN